MSITVLLFLACATVLVSGHRTWNWEKNNLQLGSLDDSDDTDSRVANAVEAALRAAQDTPVAAPTRDIPYEKYRLRLETVNRENTCGTFACNEIELTCAVGGAAGANTGHMENAVATVETDRGTFDAIFDATGRAEQLNDLVRFTVQFDGCRSFTLSTIENDLRGLNVTSITISTQNAGDAVNGNVYFRAIGDAGSFTEDNGDNDARFPFLKATNGDSAIGCDATFDQVNALGYTSFTVTPVGAPFLVTNFTDNTVTADMGNDMDEESITFSIDRSWVVLPDVLAPAVPTEQRLEDTEQIRAIGLARLPCARRNSIIYDEITIATLRKAPEFGELLDHPLLYDALQAGTAGAQPTFENFIFQLQLAAGRTQIRLRDVTLDAGAFSILSHNSKFTPCFRVWPDPDFQVQVFIGMRNGGGAMVRATLQNQNGGNRPDLVILDRTVNGNQIFRPRQLDGDSLAELPQFVVQEIAFGDLRQLNLAADPRPFEILRSDVNVVLEECPDFTYFQ